METLWSTLHSITTIKRQELAKQRDACRALRSDLLEPLEKEQDAKARVRLLLKNAGKRDVEGVTRHRKQRVSQITPQKESSQHDEILKLAGISAINIQRFLQQSELDASISPSFFTSIENRFQRALRALEIKYDYATLFSDLVTERSKEHLEAANIISDAIGFESVGRKEMLEQREEWESFAFEPSSIDPVKVTSALKSTFSSPEALQALDRLRKHMDRICHQIQHNKIRGANEMKMLVEGLIASDLLADDQTNVLKQARNSDTWPSEMADVINLRLASIENWSWETEAVQLEMRRQLNGKHRVYMLEEISQALLIYHIGIHFAVGFARCFDEFYYGPGWKKHTGVGRSDQAQWDYFIGKRGLNRPGSRSIRNELLAIFHRDFFMNVLPRHVREGAGGYGDDSLTDGGEVQSRVAKSVEAKHGLLHLLVAESLMADRLEEELYVVQTDFRWFGPSLSHSTIDAVMHFFGVNKTWRTFFEKFLQAPLQFRMDGPQGAIRRRQRGVPMSHVLSSLFGEAALFCIDYAVNETTKGKPLFRLHDDIYLWGTGEEMQLAWEALNTLASTMGIEINPDKTGSARLTKNPRISSRPYPKLLPTGPLHWGLLSTDANTGHFSIDQKAIEGHITELKRQLESRKSILSWIKAYNTYMDFFKLHLGNTCNALGRFHVDDCLATINQINKELCSSMNGNVAAYVKEKITAKFEIRNIPDGFLYFPMICGGLELRNPIISLQALRDNVLQDPSEILEEAIEREQVDYNRLKQVFDKEGAVDKEALSDRPQTFMSFEQFKVYRREHSVAFYQAWTELQLTVKEEMIQSSTEMDSYLAKLSSNGDNEHAFIGSVKQPYWRSVVELYGPEMGETFGGLQVVEKDLLPMGMIDLLRSKIRWDT